MPDRAPEGELHRAVRRVLSGGAAHRPIAGRPHRPSDHDRVASYCYHRQVKASFLLSVDGIYIADRTSSKGPVWQPTPANTK